MVIAYPFISLVFEKMFDRGILEVLRYRALLPNLDDQLMEFLCELLTTPFIDIRWYRIIARRFSR